MIEPGQVATQRTRNDEVNTNLVTRSGANVDKKIGEIEEAAQSIPHWKNCD